MSKTPKDHATLLSHKIFSANAADEVTSFIELDLDVDWLTAAYPNKHNDRTLMVERAFRVIQDHHLFEKWWGNVQRNHPGLDLWTPLSNGKQLVEILFQNSGAFCDFKTNLLLSSPGSSEQWSALMTGGSLKNFCLLPTWPSISKHLQKTTVPAQVVDSLDQYRADNLFLLAATPQEFKRDKPASFTPQHAVHMFQKISSMSLTATNFWQLQEFMNMPWNKWDVQQSLAAIKAQKHPLYSVVDFLNTNCYALADNHLGASRFNTLEKFVKSSKGLSKSLLRSDDKLVVKALNNEISGLYKLSKNIRYNHAIVEQLFNQLVDEMHQVLLSKFNASSNKLQSAFSLLKLHQLQQDGKLSMNVVQQLKLVHPLPTTWNELFEQGIPKKSSMPELVALAIHVAVASDPECQKKWIDELTQSSVGKNSFLDGRSLLPWVMEVVQHNPSSPVAAHWAEVFWTVVLDSKSSIGWLKKAFQEPALLVALPHWDERWEQRVLGLKKGAHKETEAAVNKLLMVNATAGLNTNLKASRKLKM